MVNLTGELPSSLKAKAHWERVSDADVPAMLVHPDWESRVAAPTVIWMHGRTAHKELDSGRYLRWMRAGIATCTVDLPGHGERLDESLQQPRRTLDIVMQMVEEIDGIVEALGEYGVFDTSRLAIGGISAGGMATLQRLTRSHTFTCASVEATSGAWQYQHDRGSFGELSREQLQRLDPIANLDAWREIPVQAIHSKLDEWMSFEGQLQFIDTLRERSAYPDAIEVIAYERTGAPYEHIGFGSKSPDAKNRQLEFLSRHLKG